jgi:hypothetical protein
MPYGRIAPKSPSEPALAPRPEFRDTVGKDLVRFPLDEDGAARLGDAGGSKPQ